MRVLIVEDERRATSAILKDLSSAELDIDHAGDARRALQLARRNGYDLLIADDALRGIDGASLIQHLRSVGNRTPAILVADSEVSLNKALAAGADDLVPRSSAPAEYIARVEALSRTFACRPAGAQVRLRVADLELDTISRSSARGRRLLALTIPEFSTLELLMTHCGEIISRRLIARTMLDTEARQIASAYPDAAVDLHMDRLRNKVDGRSVRKLLHKVRDAGFVLEERGRRVR